MDDSFDPRGCYGIEVSGWGFDDNFFVERTNLLWTPSGERKVELHHALPEGAIVFIRLLTPDNSNGSVPTVYRIGEAEPMDRNGRCQIKLTPLHPRSKESFERKNASKDVEDSPKDCAIGELREVLQSEEVLQ